MPDPSKARGTQQESLRSHQKVISMAGMLDSFLALFGGGLATFEDRRRGVRMRARVPVVCRSGAERFASIVVDISPQGMRLYGTPKLVKGSLVNVQHKERANDGEGVTCRVIWTRHYKTNDKRVAALQFEDSGDSLQRSWLGHPLRELQQRKGQARNSMRITCKMPAEVFTVRDEMLTSGTCRDLSEGGALLELDTQMPKNTDLMMKLGPLGTIEILQLKMQVSKVDKTLSGAFLHHVRIIDERPTKLKLLKRYLRVLFKGLGET
jgi:hypothetical protein